MRQIVAGKLQQKWRFGVNGKRSTRKSEALPQPFYSRPYFMALAPRLYPVVGDGKSSSTWGTLFARQRHCVPRRGRGLLPVSPHPPLPATTLRFAPGSCLWTKPDTYRNRVASVAMIRWCSGSIRNAVRLPPEPAFSFAGIPSPSVATLLPDQNRSRQDANDLHRPAMVFFRKCGQDFVIAADPAR